MKAKGAAIEAVVDKRSSQKRKIYNEAQDLKKHHPNKNETECNEIIQST